MATTPAQSLEVNAAAWRNMLRDIWLAQPSLAGARALLSLCLKMLQDANAFAAQLSGDRFISASLKSWRADFDASIERLNMLMDGSTHAFKQTMPGSVDRISMLTAHVVGPVLDGVYPIGFCGADGDPMPLRCRGLTSRPDGTFKGMGVAFDVASLWNRLVAAWSVDSGQVAEGTLADFARKWLSEVEHDLSESAPGEAPTTYDKVTNALETAKQSVADIGRAAARKILLYAAGAAAVVVVAYLLLRDR